MYRIIVVDDEEITRNALEKYISKYFPQFKLLGTFCDGTDAFAFLKDNPVEIVITDIRMPNMDGLELSKRISELLPKCLIFIISGYGEFEYAKTAMQYGVSNYILKPLDFEELRDCLEKSIDNLDDMYNSINSLNFQTEDIEIFFIDLMMGMLTEKKDLEHRFQSLKLPFSLNQSSGIIIQLSLLKNDVLIHWKYGLDKIGTALLNALQMGLENMHIYPFFISGADYYFISIYKTSPYPLNADQIEKHIYKLLSFDCQVSLKNPFQNLNDLHLMNAKELPIKNPISSPLNSNDIVINKAIEYINKYYYKDLTREEVADAVYLSSAYFSRFFKQKTGQSFFDYLTTVRMQKAIELLYGKMKINDIAKKVGYQSRNRFFINFRQYTSCNPTEYRSLILKIGDTNEEN